jgi:hypothetical protein
MALGDFAASHRSVVGETANVSPRWRWNRSAPKHIAAARRPAAPSRRLAAVRMAPSTFLWLIGGWMAGLAVLVAMVLALRSLA